MTTIANRRETLAAALVRSWAALYTLGANEAERNRRRMEVESDVWEHEQDRLGAGAAPSLVGLEILGRMVRGMPADLFWRLKLEGQPMQLNIPFERVTGVALLLLVVLIPAGLSINGYDTARDSWDTELYRLGQMSDTAIRVNLFFQVITGSLLVIAAAAFYVALRDRAPVHVTIAAFSIAAAGVLVLATSAVYRATSSLADEYVVGQGGEGAFLTSRALALMMVGLVTAAGVLLAVGVCSLAMGAHQQRLVPQWLIWLPVGSVAVIGGTIVAGAFDLFGGAEWVAFMSGVVLLGVWLAIAGLVLTFGSTTNRPTAAPPLPAPLAP